MKRNVDNRSKVSNKDLKKLKRAELLEIMLEQGRQIDSLKEEIDKLQKELENKTIQIEESGSLAEASLRVTKIFTEAQKAVDVYLYNRKRELDQQFRSTEARSDRKAGD